MMSDKRYQVFVSSTYTDLKEERQVVIQTLMEMDCIPAGMELFPAADQDQFEFIKKIIDDCDYYLLIIGGRYGSETTEGISYTEKEYDYAVQKGIKVIALIHDNIENLPAKDVDGDPEIKKRLDAFREKAKTGRVVKFWNNSDHLAGLVALSLTKTIKMHPAVGWVRANQGSSTELLSQLNSLRQKNEALQSQLDTVPKPSSIDISTLSQGDDQFALTGTMVIGHTQKTWNYETTWNSLFAMLGPELFNGNTDSSIGKRIAQYALKQKNINTTSLTLDVDIKNQIKIQLNVLGLITFSGNIWKITDYGKDVVTQLLVVKKEPVDPKKTV